MRIDDDNIWVFKESNNDERVCVFIDGNNLYHRLVEAGWPKRINISSFASRLAGDRQLVQVYYFNAPPPKGAEHFKKGSDYLAYVARSPRVTYRQSRLQKTKRPDVDGGMYNTFIEKGADTALSAEIVACAASDDYDTAIIVSNDSDYEPAARLVMDRYSKNVEVAYFQGSRPYVMAELVITREVRRSYLTEMDFERSSRRGDSGRRRRTGRSPDSRR